jgi:site-specific DNA-methyltransferase (adenine-specific)
MERIALYNDSFQNWKSHDILKAQLILTDIPYQLGDSAYGSNPMWYNGGNNDNGESKYAHKSFFDTDSKAGFRIPEFFNFCSNLLIKEPKTTGKSPCMILFCAFEQQFELINEAQKYGFNHYINLVFRKNFSAQVLKANMRVVGNCEYGLIFYRDKLPKFNNYGKMVFNCMDWVKDTVTPKCHETQKPVPVLENLIRIFTDIDDVVIDCCAGVGTTLLAAENTGRKAYGFEIKKQFVKDYYEKIKPCCQLDMFAAKELDNRKYKQLTFNAV